MPRNKITHIEFAKMAQAFALAKTDIEAKLKVSTLEQLARDRGIPKSTFRSLCEAVDIDVRACLFPPKEKKAILQPLLIQDILTVMGRICTELKIDGGEIKKYLN